MRSIIKTGVALLALLALGAGAWAATAAGPAKNAQDTRTSR